MNEKSDSSEILKAISDFCARANAKNPGRQKIIETRVKNVNRLLFIEKDRTEELIKPKFSKISLLKDRIHELFGPKQISAQEDPKSASNSNPNITAEMIDSEKMNELLQIIDEYKLRRKPLKLDLQSRSSRSITLMRSSLKNQSFELADCFLDSQASTLMIGMNNHEKRPILKNGQDFSSDYFSKIHQEKTQQNDHSLNQSLNISKLNGRKRPVPKRVQPASKNFKSSKEKSNDSSQPSEAIEKKDSKQTAKKRASVLRKDSDPKLPHTKTESKKSRGRKPGSRKSSASSAESQEDSPQQKDAENEEVNNASLVDIIFAPEYKTFNPNSKSSSKSKQSFVSFQEFDFETYFRIPRTEDIVLLDFLSQLKRSKVRNIDVIMKSIEGFCDQYSFIIRRKFGPKDFLEHMENLMKGIE